MSSVLYNRQWKRACTELENIKINYEPAAEDPPIIDRKEALQKLINLFIRYSKVNIYLTQYIKLGASPRRSFRPIIEKTHSTLHFEGFGP